MPIYPNEEKAIYSHTVQQHIQTIEHTKHDQKPIGLDKSKRRRRR